MSTMNDKLLESSVDDHVTPGGSKFQAKTYCARWHMLIIFFCLSFTNGMMWISFAPVTANTAQFYNITAVQVNLLSLSYMFLFLPGTLLTSWLIHKFGLKACMVVGSVLGALGGVVRFVSLLVPTEMLGVTSAFWVLLFGQSLCGLSQPCFVNVVAKLAGAWFPKKERDISLILASLASTLGNVAGQVLPSLIVVCVAASPSLWNTPGASAADPGQSCSVQGLGTLLLIQAGMGVALVLWTVVGFKGEPDHAPSLSEHSRRIHRQNTLEKGVSATSEICAEMKALFTNRDFLFLLSGFGVGLGIFNGMLTLLQQVIQPVYYHNASHPVPDFAQAQLDAGLLGGVLIGAGLFNAVAVGFILDHTHWYRSVLKTLIGLSVTMIIVFHIALQPGNTVWLFVSMAFMGVAMLPLLPVTVEAAVECTYPVSEETSSGLLMLSGQIVGIIVVFVMPPLIDMRSNWYADGPFRETVITPEAILVCGLALLAMVGFMLFNGQYKRLEAERDAEDEADNKAEEDREDDPSV